MQSSPLIYYTTLQLLQVKPVPSVTTSARPAPPPSHLPRFSQLAPMGVGWREERRRSSRLVGMISSEITAVTTQLRAELRAAAAAYRLQPAAAKLLSSFAAAQTRVLNGGVEGDCMAYLEPFLETIRNEDTSGVVTQRALCAVRAFLSAGIIALDEASGRAGMAAIVRAATYCRFEVTDPAGDEVVLMCILQLLVSCVECSSGESAHSSLAPGRRRRPLPIAEGREGTFTLHDSHVAPSPLPHNPHTFTFTCCDKLAMYCKRLNTRFVRCAFIRRGHL